MRGVRLFAAVSRHTHASSLQRPFAAFNRARFSTEVSDAGKKEEEVDLSKFSSPTHFTSGFTDEGEKHNVRDIDVAKENLLDDVINKGDLTAEEREDMERVASFMCANNKEIQQRQVRNMIEKYQRFPGDTGSTEVQGTVSAVVVAVRWIVVVVVVVGSSPY